MAGLLRLVFSAIVSYGVAEVLQRGSVSRERLRRTLIGLLLLIAAASVGLLTITLLLAAIFLQLSDTAQYVKPALITSLVSGCATLLLGLWGAQQLKKP